MEHVYLSRGEVFFEDLCNGASMLLRTALALIHLLAAAARLLDQRRCVNGFMPGISS
jgi:hypothetical protein